MQNGKGSAPRNISDKFRRNLDTVKGRGESFTRKCPVCGRWISKAQFETHMAKHPLSVSAVKPPQPRGASFIDRMIRSVVNPQ